MENLLLVVDGVHYTVNHAERKEPYQLVGVWCRDNPFPVKIFEVVHTASKDHIIDCIKAYNAGYEAGYNKGEFNIQDQLKQILKIKDRS